MAVPTELDYGMGTERAELVTALADALAVIIREADLKNSQYTTDGNKALRDAVAASVEAVMPPQS